MVFSIKTSLTVNFLRLCTSSALKKAYTFRKLKGVRFWFIDLSAAAVIHPVLCVICLCRYCVNFFLGEVFALSAVAVGNAVKEFE